MLELLGVKTNQIVDTCLNGEQSVALMEKAIREGEHDRYSLILTDMSMPFMDGYEASKRMRQLQRAYTDQFVDASNFKLKIVAVTGHVEPLYLEKAKKCGID